MTQVVIKKEKPCILTEEFFEAGMYLKDDENHIYITGFDSDKEEMFVMSLDNGERFRFRNPINSTYTRIEYTILEKGTVLEITV